MDLDGKAYVDDKLVAEAELKAMIVDRSMNNIHPKP